MCEYEEYIFNCGCSQKRLNSYCHLARNDANHQCFGIKKLRHVWEQQTECKSCIAKRAFASASWQQQQQQQQQQQHAQYR